MSRRVLAQAGSFICPRVSCPWPVCYTSSLWTLESLVLVMHCRLRFSVCRRAVCVAWPVSLVHYMPAAAFVRGTTSGALSLSRRDSPAPESACFLSAVSLGGRDHAPRPLKSAAQWPSLCLLCHKGRRACHPRRSPVSVAPVARALSCPVCSLLLHACAHRLGLPRSLSCLVSSLLWHVCGRHPSVRQVALRQLSRVYWSVRHLRGA